MCPLTPPLRLQAVAQALSPLPGPVVADVATGRGELAIYLAGRQMCARVIATDSSARAVSIVSGLVAAAALPTPVEVRHGDGFAPLAPGEANVVVIAGIGARLMVRMLSSGAGSKSGGLGRLGAPGFELPALVLQPMSEAGVVRRWAEQTAPGQGYALTAERLVLDGGRFYHIFTLVPGGTGGAQAPGCPAKSQTVSHSAWVRRLPAEVIADIGAHLLMGPDPLLPDYLAWRSARLANLAVAAAAGGSVRGAGRAKSAASLAGAMSVAAGVVREELSRAAGERGHGQ